MPEIEWRKDMTDEEQAAYERRSRLASVVRSARSAMEATENIKCHDEGIRKIMALAFLLGDAIDDARAAIALAKEIIAAEGSM